MGDRKHYSYDQIVNRLWTWEGKEDTAENRNMTWLRNFWAELPAELHTMLIRNTVRLANSAINGIGIMMAFEIACRTLIKELQLCEDA